MFWGDEFVRCCVEGVCDAVSMSGIGAAKGYVVSVANVRAGSQTFSGAVNAGDVRVDHQLK